jgi:hypothetical protein
VVVAAAAQHDAVLDPDALSPKAGRIPVHGQQGRGRQRVHAQLVVCSQQLSIKGTPSHSFCACIAPNPPAIFEVFAQMSGKTCFVSLFLFKEVCRPEQTNKTKQQNLRAFGTSQSVHALRLSPYAHQGPGVDGLRPTPLPTFYCRHLHH